jgi:hypothetical protein
MNPWTWSQTGGAFSPSSSIIFTSGTNVYSDIGVSGRGFKGITNANTDSTLTLQQTGIKFPEGTIIDIAAAVKPMRSKDTTDKPFSITLKFDGVVVGSVLKPTGSQEDTWVTMGTTASTRVTVKGAGPHTLSLEVRTKNLRGSIFTVDDFSVTAHSYPVGSRACPQSK